MLKKIVLPLFVVLLGLSMGITEVSAARLGGGRSMGMQRQVAPPQRTVQPSASPQQGQLAPNQALNKQPMAAPQPAAQSGWRRWAGPLAGIAAGIGLAAMLSHFGIGGDVAGILLAVLAAVVVFALLRRMFSAGKTPAPQAAYAGSYANPAPDNVSAFRAAPVAGGGTIDTRFPAGFDAPAFERQAKVNFIRLQAANDARNLQDIRDFTTPEMFAEIKLAIDERGNTEQRTDVVVLEAEVLQVLEENQQYVASVHFTGSLREESNAAPQAFSEVWHLSKPVDGSRGWMLGGIQQMN